MCGPTQQSYVLQTRMINQVSTCS